MRRAMEINVCLISLETTTTTTAMFQLTNQIRFGALDSLAFEERERERWREMEELLDESRRDEVTLRFGKKCGALLI